MRRLLLAAGAVFALGAVAAPAHAVTDPTGDFLPTFVGDEDPDLDVTRFTVFFDAGAQAFNMHATFAGDINPDRFGLYAIGVKKGPGGVAPFGDIGNPNVIFHQVIAVQKSGATNLGATINAVIDGDSFSLVVPLTLPTTGFGPTEYGFNLWPRNGADPANNTQISDFAPDDALMLASVPEPATWAMLIAGFGLVGGVLRRRDLRTAVPV